MADVHKRGVHHLFTEPLERASPVGFLPVASKCFYAVCETQIAHGPVPLDAPEKGASSRWNSPLKPFKG